MSFPNIRVLNRFLADYIEIREPTWHSTSSLLMNKGNQLLSTGAQVLSKLSATLFSSSDSPIHEEEKIEKEDDQTAITSVCKALKGLLQKPKTWRIGKKQSLILGMRRVNPLNAVKRLSFVKPCMPCALIYSNTCDKRENLKATSQHSGKKNPPWIVKSSQISSII